jgi:uncharacterized protein YhfF
MRNANSDKKPAQTSETSVKDSVRRMWREYCAVAAMPPDTPLPPVWHFCDNRADADVCAALVRGGRKRATAPSLWGLLSRGEPLPDVGTLDLITAWDGEARAIIRTTRVVICPFSHVSADHAAAEGEGDGSLSWWRRVHLEYYSRELAETQYTVSEEMPIVCQYFELVYPPPE